MSDDDKKIIVDEDWKTQVERERKLAEEKAASGEAEPGEAASAEGGAPTEEELAMQQSPFNALVGSLATQAMYSLGVIAPQDGSDQVMVNLEEAAMLVEMLLTLKDKTEGNLDEMESKMLDEAVTELQRVFQARLAQMQEQAMQEKPGLDIDALKNPLG